MSQSKAISPEQEKERQADALLFELVNTEDEVRFNTLYERLLRILTGKESL